MLISGTNAAAPAAARSLAVGRRTLMIVPGFGRDLFPGDLPGHNRAGSAPTPYKPLGRKQPKHFARRHARHTVQLGQFALARHRFAEAAYSRPDSVAELPRYPCIRGDSRVTIHKRSLT